MYAVRMVAQVMNLAYKKVLENISAIDIENVFNSALCHEIKCLKKRGTNTYDDVSENA